MKFIVDLTKCAPRLGFLKEFHRLPNHTLDTPALFLYTRGGSIPHITQNVLQFLTEDYQNLQISVANSFSLKESLVETDMNVSEFVGLPECIAYITVQDPGDMTPGGHHLQNQVPIWTRSGKVYLNPDSYMDIIEAYKPDMYSLLSDSDTMHGSSKKRMSKSVEQTLYFLEQCLDRHSNSNTLQHSAIIAPIEGGYCLHSRNRCLEGVLKHKDKFGGFLINGLHNNGPEMEFLPGEEVFPIVKHILNALPENKLRIMEGCWNPVNVIKLIRLGVDIFDASFVHMVTERHGVLVFDYHLKDQQNLNSNKFEINLKDDMYSEDFSPLVYGCRCLTCTGYTKSYIHHLINVGELLGPVLLTLHNIHHYVEFFKQIRNNIQKGKIEEFENFIDTQYVRFTTKKTEPDKEVLVL